MAEQSEKGRFRKSDTADGNEASGALFDKGSLIAIAFVLILLILALLISWIPSLLSKPPAGEANQSSLFQDQFNQLNQSDWSSIFGANTTSQSDSSTRSICNEMLTNGSEIYNYSYKITTANNTSSEFKSGIVINSGQSTNRNVSFVRTTELSFNMSELARTMQVNYTNGTSGVADELALQWITSIQMSSIKILSYLNRNMTCIDAEAVIFTSGNETRQQIECDSGMVSGLGICKDNLVEKGNFTITVPAGTFSTRQYVGEGNSTIFMSDLPLPVRTSGNSSMMELVSYRLAGIQTVMR